MNCRGRALPEVPVLRPLLPIRHPPPSISSSRLGAALWGVFNVQTSFWLCSKSAGELRMSTFPAVPGSVKPARFQPLSALLLACSHSLTIVALEDCSHPRTLQSLSNLHPLCKLLVLLLTIRGGFAAAWEAQSQSLLMESNGGVQVSG